MTLPSWFFTDPSRVADRLEAHERTEKMLKQGCTACKHCVKAWDFDYCAKGRIMPRNGLCRGFEDG